MQQLPSPKPAATVLQRLYPERRFSRFHRDEGRFIFYSLVADLLKAEDVVLDLGAGRGQQVQSAKGHLRFLLDFRGRCKKDIGVDPDEIVLSNPFLNEAYVMDQDGKIPLADNSVDLICSFAVLEHVGEPHKLAKEVQRVLRPGGWFCSWTPNKWSYIGILVRIVPNRLHSRLASLVD